MKKLSIAAFVLACAASVLGQGAVIFNNRIVGSIVTHIYGPNPADPSMAQAGNGPGDTPAGTADWSAYPLLSGAGYTAQLWAAPGLNQPESSLVAAYPTTSFRTGQAAGFFTGIYANMPNVPYGTMGATMLVRVWDNQGGTITSWADALALGHGAVGESSIFNLTAGIAGPMATQANVLGYQSFNLHSIPEPSVLALAGLAVALWCWRRREPGGPHLWSASAPGIRG
jgi:hypothetical protein